MIFNRVIIKRFRQTEHDSIGKTAGSRVISSYASFVKQIV
jgi:hypothetical protein